MLEGWQRENILKALRQLFKAVEVVYQLQRTALATAEDVAGVRISSDQYLNEYIRWGGFSAQVFFLQLKHLMNNGAYSVKTFAHAKPLRLTAAARDFNEAGKAHIEDPNIRTLWTRVGRLTGQELDPCELEATRTLLHPHHPVPLDLTSLIFWHGS